MYSEIHQEFVAGLILARVRAQITRGDTAEFATRRFSIDSTFYAFGLRFMRAYHCPCWCQITYADEAAFATQRGYM